MIQPDFDSSERAAQFRTIIERMPNIWYGEDFSEWRDLLWRLAFAREKENGVLAALSALRDEENARMEKVLDCLGDLESHVRALQSDINRVDGALRILEART